MSRKVLSTTLGLIGAAVGGALGYFLFLWALTRGFYALILPGALLGLGCNVLARHRSLARGIVCAVAGFVLTLHADWRFEKFPDDASFGYFATHFYRLEAMTLAMLALGTLFAFWWGRDYHNWGGGREKPTAVEPPRSEEPRPTA